MNINMKGPHKKYIIFVKPVKTCPKNRKNPPIILMNYLDKDS